MLQFLTEYPLRPVKQNDKSVTSLSACNNRKTFTKLSIRKIRHYPFASVLTLNRSFDKRMSNTSDTASLTCQKMMSSKDSLKIPHTILLTFYLYFICLLLPEGLGEQQV